MGGTGCTLKFGMPEGHLRRISLATLLGTLVAAPIIFGAAEVALADLDAQAGADVLRAAEQVGWGSLACAGWALAACLSMLLSCRRPGWRRQHLVWCVFFLAGSQVRAPPPSRRPPAALPPPSGACVTRG
jgi:hypothetical protein